jgi:hypothetical protein
MKKVLAFTTALLPGAIVVEASMILLLLFNN